MFVVYVLGTVFYNIVAHFRAVCLPFSTIVIVIINYFYYRGIIYTLRTDTFGLFSLPSPTVGHDGFGHVFVSLLSLSYKRIIRIARVYSTTVFDSTRIYTACRRQTTKKGGRELFVVVPAPCLFTSTNNVCARSLI